MFRLYSIQLISKKPNQGWSARLFLSSSVKYSTIASFLDWLTLELQHESDYGNSEFELLGYEHTIDFVAGNFTQESCVGKRIIKGVVSLAGE